MARGRQGRRDAAPSPPVPEPTARPSGGDADGSDRGFDAWSEAQSIYGVPGGPGRDPHGLDPDGDGMACEELRGDTLAPARGPG